MRNTKLNKHSVFGILLITLTIGISTALVLLNSNKTYSVTNADCSGIQMVLSNQTTSESTVALSPDQVSTFKIYIPSTIAQTTDIVISATDQATNTETVIGKAKPLSNTTAGTTSAWDFVWPTFLWSRPTATNGIISLNATLKFNGAGSCTFNSPTKYYIQYTTPTNIPLNLATIPTSIGVTTGSTNNIITAKPTIVSPIAAITADSLLNYAINYGIFEWSNNIGSISNSASSYISSNVVYFNAGSSAGTGKVSAVLKYGGSTSNTAVTPITVKAVETVTTTTTGSTSSTTTVSATSTTNTGNSSSTTTDQNSTTTTTATAESKDVTTNELSTITQVSSSQITITNDVVTCVKTGLGSDERYIAISSGKEHPTTAEYNKIYNCFASTKYVIPTVFLPVATTSIDELPTTTAVAVSNLQNTTKKVDNTTKDLLKFTGKSTPNTKVFIYIFSDPLVIATTTDADGNWQYTLEDPLVPGKHEVYAVVNQGDGSYKRSDPMSFFISEASASAVNPNKLSLKLAKTPTVTQGNLYYYIAGSVGLLIFGLVVLFLSLNIRKHKKTIAMIHDTNCPNCNTPVHEMLNPTPITPVNPIQQNTTPIIPNQPVDNIQTAPTQTINIQTPEQSNDNESQ